MGRGRTSNSSSSSNSSNNNNSSRLRRRNTSSYYNSNNSDSLGNDNATSTADDIKSSGHYNSALHSIDKFHNDSIPCCNAIREIVCDIFPDVIVSEDVEGQGNNNNNSSNSNSNSNSNNNDSKRKAIPSKKASLLSLIIRQYLLDERQKERTVGGSSSIDQSNGGSNNGSTATSNQKKKRKKKKKKQTQTGTVAEAPNESVTVTVTVGDVSASAAAPPPPAPATTDCISTSTSSCITKEINIDSATTIIEEEPLITQTKNKKNTCAVPTAEGFNVLLDEILIQQQQSSSSISSNNNALSSPPENRTLQSLFDYIHKKYNNHGSQTTTTKNKKGSTHSNSNSNSNGGFNANSHNKTASFPSIALRELSDRICNNIKCIPCKRATEQYIDAISKPSIKSNNNKSSCSIDWGDVVMNLNQNSGNSNNNNSNSNNNNSSDRDKNNDEKIKKIDARATEEIRSFHLDSESIRVSPKEDKKCSLNNATTSAYTLPGPDGIVHDYGDDDFDHNYYALMEEGNGGNAVNATRKENSDEKDASVDEGLMLNVIKVQKSGAKFIELSPSEYPMTLRRFINLIKEVVVPCGLNELENYNQVTLTKDGEQGEGDDVSKNVILDLRQRYNNLLSDIVQMIRRIQSIFIEIKNCLEDATANSGPSTKFGVKASQALLSCEKKQLAYMEEVALFLNRIHSCTTQARLIKHDDHKWIIEFVARLWDNYEESVRSFVEPSLEYLWKVIQLNSKHTGSVPQMYNCPITRGYLIDMLSKKRDIIEHLLQRNIIDKLLQRYTEKNAVSKPPSTFDIENPTEEQSQNNLERILLLSTYFSWLKKDSGIDTSPGFDCKAIITERNELVCSRVFGSKVSTILEAHSSRITNLRSKGQGCVELVDGQSIDGSFVVPQNYATFWDTNKIMIEEKLMEDEILSDKERSFACDVPEMTNLCGLIEYINKQCRLSRDIQVAEAMEKNDSSGGIAKHHKMPKWIRKIHSTEEEEEPQDKEGQASIATTKCNGGSGKRRVMCILSACLYSWIEERCMEWHADLTHEELLLDADEELANLGKVNTSSQRSKKSKKKKRKSSGKKETNQNLHTNKEDTNGCSSQIEPILEENEAESGDQADTIREENEVEFVSKEDKDEKEEKKDNDTEESLLSASYTHSQRVKEGHGDEEDFNVDCNQLEEYNVNITVFDRSSQTSVEDYLCERFYQILKDGEFIII